MKNHLKNNKSIDVLYVAIASVLILIALYPFWLFGEYSSLGWYDEVDGQIPWYFNYLALDITDGFYHNWAGGAGSAFGYGTESISFYRFLSDTFPVWIANLITRFFNLFFGFFGTYLLLRNFFGSPKLLAFSSGIFVLFASYILYGWTLGGMGWDMTVTVWLALAFFGRFANIRINYIVGTAVCLIAPTVSSFLFVFVFVFFFFLAWFFSFDSIRKVKKQPITLWLSIGLLFTTLMFLNWQNLYFVSVGAKEFSTRLLGIFSNNHNISGTCFELYTYHFRDAIKHILKLSDHFSTSILIASYFIIIVLAIVKNRYKPLIVFGFIIVFFPLFFTPLTKLYDMGIISSYRWSMVWMLVPLSVVVIINDLLAYNAQKFLWIKNHQTNRRITFFAVIFVSGILIYKSYDGAKILSDYTINKLDEKNGNAITFYYKELERFKNTNYRSLSDAGSIWWALPIYYGIDTFGGLQPAFPHRRTSFLAYGSLREKTDEYHHSKHYFWFHTDKQLYNTNMLEMANVKYIISSKPTIPIEAKQVLKISGTQYKSIKQNSTLSSLTPTRFDNISVAKDLYVYTLNNPWPRVFGANKVSYSKYSFKDKQFYDELNSTGYLNILVAADDFNRGQNNFATESNIKIKNFSLSKNGAEISIDKGQGYVVFNQVYVPHWKAYCDSDELPIIPVNGIMMSVNVDRKCDVITFKYDTSK